MKSFQRVSPAGKYAYWFDGGDRAWEAVDLRTLEVLSTDKGSANDIPEWVNKVGHQIVSNTA